MNQCEMILRHLESFGEITAAEAMSDYGIYRLAARIADLRKLGYHISSRMEKGKNRFGEHINFAVYE